MVSRKPLANYKLPLVISVIVAGIFIFISISHYIFSLMYAVQPTPFLDEVFHIPQARRYCKGLFKEWDPKITTLPGLYLLSVGVLGPLSWIAGEDLCGVYALRFINLMSCFINLFLLFAIQRKIKLYRKGDYSGMDENCLLCGDELKQLDTLAVVIAKELKTLIKASVVREDGLHEQLEAVSSIRVHRYCHMEYTRERNLKITSTPAPSTMPDPVPVLRRSLLQYNKHSLSCSEEVVLDTIHKDTITFCSDLLSAVNLTTFPVLYFFTFLYYTDTVSTSLVLLLYLLHLENCHSIATATGAVSVMVRQTNIIWIAFFGLLTAARVFKRQALLTRRRISPNVPRSIRNLQILLDTFLRLWKSGKNSLTHFIMVLLGETFSYILICLTFQIFVIYNGGVVVGDKSAHIPVIHLPQLFYFSMFTTFFCFPYFITSVLPFIKCIATHKRTFLLCFLVCSVIVHFNTLVHPYLLADNRHYTFYIWKRLYEGHDTVKYGLIMVYMFGMFSMFQVLKQTNIVFQLSYLLCIFLCLVPQKLLEFRYYIFPFLLFRLQITTKHWWQLVVEFCLFSLVNAATISLFMTRVFYWKDTTEAQRFLW